MAKTHWRRALAAGSMAAIAVPAFGDSRLEAVREQVLAPLGVHRDSGQTMAPVGAAAATHAGRPVTAGQPVRIRFKRASNFLIAVEGAIGKLGHLTLLVDTGTYRTVIDRRIARRLELSGSPDVLVVFGREVATDRVVVPSIQVGPIRMADLPVLSADLHELGGALGVRLDAIIGLDVLRGSCLDIDYEARTLAFGCPKPCERSVSFDRRSPYLVLETIIDGHPYRLLMDTGSDAIAIFQRASPARRPVGTDRELVAVHVAGPMQLGRFTARSLRLGDQELGAHPVFVMPGPGEDPGYDGVFGARWVSARIQVDLERMVLGWEERSVGRMPPTPPR